MSRPPGFAPDDPVGVAPAEGESMPEGSLDRVEFLLASAVKALETSQRQRDSKTVLAAIREARACLELTAKLNGELAAAAQLAVQVNVGGGVMDGTLDEQVEALLGEVKAHLSPTCGICGEPCSACHTELVGRPRPLRAPVGLPAPVEDAVVVEDAVAPSTAPSKAIPAQPGTRTPKPVSVKPKERGPSWEERFRHARVNDVTGNGVLWNNRDVW